MDLVDYCAVIAARKAVYLELARLEEILADIIVGASQASV
jgi:hypothetical protein